LNCEIAFVVWYDRTTKDGVLTKNDGGVREIVPLVEKDGFLLTPHDVWQEEYKKEHGEYPVEAYG
jgi:hypothetical protein